MVLSQRDRSSIRIQESQNVSLDVSSFGGIPCCFPPNVLSSNIRSIIFTNNTVSDQTRSDQIRSTYNIRSRTVRSWTPQILVGTAPVNINDIRAQHERGLALVQYLAVYLVLSLYIALARWGVFGTPGNFLERLWFAQSNHQATLTLIENSVGRLSGSSLFRMFVQVQLFSAPVSEVIICFSRRILFHRWWRAVGGGRGQCVLAPSRPFRLYTPSERVELALLVQGVQKYGNIVICHLPYFFLTVFVRCNIYSLYIYPYFVWSADSLSLKALILIYIRYTVPYRIPL